MPAQSASDFTFPRPWHGVPRPAISARQIKVLLTPETTTLKVKAISSPCRLFEGHVGRSIEDVWISSRPAGSSHMKAE